jgi:hypothetical protein
LYLRTAFVSNFIIAGTSSVTFSPFEKIVDKSVDKAPPLNPQKKDNRPSNLKFPR